MVSIVTAAQRWRSFKEYLSPNISQVSVGVETKSAMSSPCRQHRLPPTQSPIRLEAKRLSGYVQGGALSDLCLMIRCAGPKRILVSSVPEQILRFPKRIPVLP
jgi:hypothetical protein